MEERDFTELEVRRMLDAASSMRPTRAPGRFVVSSRRRGTPWFVVLEPDFADRLVYVVTAFPEDQS